MEETAANEYAIPAVIENAKLVTVQRFGDIPVAAKIEPSLLTVGCKKSLNLLNKDLIWIGYCAINFVADTPNNRS